MGIRKNTIKIKTALISLSDKSNLRPLLNLLKNDQGLQKAFSNFMEKVILRVLNNLNINLPFNRSEIIQKN